MRVDLLAVVLAGAAGWVLSGRGLPARDRLRRLCPPPGPRPAVPGRPPAGRPREPDRRRLLTTAASARPTPVVCGIGVAALALAGQGLLAVLVTAASLMLLLPARRSRAVADRERGELERSLPRAADLLAACLEAGATPADALLVVCDQEGGVLRAALHPVVTALHLGVDPAAAWALAGRAHPRPPAATNAPTAAPTAGPPSAALHRLGRAFVRAAVTGAPLAAAVAAVADDERERTRWAAEASARRAGVRVVAPLAVCFLPAFLLLGVVPFVAAVAGDVLAGLR